MIKHYIDASTNTYIIEKDDVVVFSVELNKDDSVTIKTANDTYTGDIAQASVRRKAQKNTLQEILERARKNANK